MGEGSHGGGGSVRIHSPCESGKIRRVHNEALSPCPHSLNRSEATFCSKERATNAWVETMVVCSVLCEVLTGNEPYFLGPLPGILVVQELDHLSYHQ